MGMLTSDVRRRDPEYHEEALRHERQVGTELDRGQAPAEIVAPPTSAYTTPQPMRLAATLAYPPASATHTTSEPGSHPTARSASRRASVPFATPIV
jgi:hypothetical protein